MKDIMDHSLNAAAAPTYDDEASIRLSPLVASTTAKGLIERRQKMLQNTQTSFRVQQLIGRHGKAESSQGLPQLYTSSSTSANTAASQNSLLLSGENSMSFSLNNQHNNANNPHQNFNYATGGGAGGQGGNLLQRSARSMGSSGLFRVPRNTSNRQRLLHGSMSGSSSWHNSSISKMSGMTSIPDFGNSIQITDFLSAADAQSAREEFGTAASISMSNNNNNNTFPQPQAYQQQYPLPSQNQLQQQQTFDASFTDLQSTANLTVHSLSSNISRWGQQSVKFRANHFVVSNVNDSLESHYRVDDLLGEGGFGEVYQCTHLASGEQRAVKVIAKHDNDEDNCKVIAEFDIVKNLDHPNVLRLYALYESETHFFLVTDLYAGGELYDVLEECGRFSEQDAALLLNHMLSCLNHCHKKKLAHRDLKPENILLEETRNFEDVKIIDFGLAKFGDVFTELEGSTYYMSPQVIEGRYNHKCDIWSAGVICYVCLSGFAPFDGEQEEDVVQAILCGRVDFEDPVWDDISEEAMDFISYLMTYEEENRPTAEEALQHPWLQHVRKQQNSNCAKTRASKRSSLGNLQNFEANSKLKQCVCSLIASQLLKKHEKEEIDSVFRSLDHDCDGKLTRQDVLTSYKECFGRTLSKEELDSMFAQVNMSGSGAIEYSEFAVATLLQKNLIDDFKLMAAFKIFDKENKGFISVDNLKEVLALDDDMEGYILNVIVRQVDLDRDGRISFAEFKNMMFRHGPAPSASHPRKRSGAAPRRAKSHDGSIPIRSNHTGLGGGTTRSVRTAGTRSAADSDRGHGSHCDSTLSGESSFSMASINLAIEEDLFEDNDSVDRPPNSVAGDGRLRNMDQLMEEDNMSMGSFAHMLHMFDDRNQQRPPR